MSIKTKEFLFMAFKALFLCLDQALEKPIKKTFRIAKAMVNKINIVPKQWRTKI